MNKKNTEKNNLEGSGIKFLETMVKNKLWEYLHVEKKRRDIEKGLKLQERE